MPANMNEAIQRIKKAGKTNVRLTPMTGGADADKYQIEVRDGNGWSVVAEGIFKPAAESLINQATNRVLCG